MGENASIKKKQKNDNNNFDWNNILSARDKSNRIHKKNTFDDSKANHQNMPRKNVSRAKMKRGIVLPLNGKWFWAVSHFFFFFSGARFVYSFQVTLLSVGFVQCMWLEPEVHNDAQNEHHSTHFSLSPNVLYVHRLPNLVFRMYMHTLARWWVNDCGYSFFLVKSHMWKDAFAGSEFVGSHKFKFTTFVRRVHVCKFVFVVMCGHHTTYIGRGRFLVGVSHVSCFELHVQINANRELR